MNTADIERDVKRETIWTDFIRKRTFTGHVTSNSRSLQMVDALTDLCKLN